MIARAPRMTRISQGLKYRFAFLPCCFSFGPCCCSRCLLFVVIIRVPAFVSTLWATTVCGHYKWLLALRAFAMWLWLRTVTSICHFQRLNIAEAPASISKIQLGPLLWLSISRRCVTGQSDIPLIPSAIPARLTAHHCDFLDCSEKALSNGLNSLRVSSG
jgi:hypothetical protein